MPGAGEVAPLPPGNPPIIFAAIVTAISTAIGYGIMTFKVESILAGMAKPGTEMAYLAVMGALMFFDHLYLSGIQVKARKKYGVPHPIVYPTLEDVKGDSKKRISFICAMRSAENFQEWMSVFQLALAILIFALKMPLTGSLLGSTFAIGRLLYGIGYGTGVVAARIPGFIISVLPFAGTYGIFIVYAATTLLL